MHIVRNENYPLTDNLIPENPDGFLTKIQNPNFLKKIYQKYAIESDDNIDQNYRLALKKHVKQIMEKEGYTLSDFFSIQMSSAISDAGTNNTDRRLFIPCIQVKGEHFVPPCQGVLSMGVGGKLYPDKAFKDSFPHIKTTQQGNDEIEKTLKVENPNKNKKIETLLSESHKELLKLISLNNSDNSHTRLISKLKKIQAILISDNYRVYDNYSGFTNRLSTLSGLLQKLQTEGEINSTNNRFDTLKQTIYYLGDIIIKDNFAPERIIQAKKVNKHEPKDLLKTIEEYPNSENIYMIDEDKYNKTTLAQPIGRIRSAVVKLTENSEYQTKYGNYEGYLSALSGIKELLIDEKLDLTQFGTFKKHLIRLTQIIVMDRHKPPH